MKTVRACVAALTTVGYGDVYPITPGGCVFTFVVLIIGLGVICVPAGLVASALYKAREMNEKPATIKSIGERKTTTARVVGE